MPLTIRKITCICVAISVLYGVSLTVTAETIEDPCSGPAAILAIQDRPSVGDTACAVPDQRAVLELGYQYQRLFPAGVEYNLPEAVFRLGLPAQNEFVVLLPNYIHQSMQPHAGFTASGIGIKHEIGYTDKWIGAAEILFALPTGSTAFGSKGLGTAINGIIGYNFTAQFNTTFMLGVTSETESRYDGGRRFTSINPDLVLTWSPKDTISIFGEMYGQSKTGPGEGSGFNFDCGVIYLVHKDLSVDVEVGQHVSGKLGGFKNFVGTGMTIEF